jgi:endonuclease G
MKLKILVAVLLIPLRSYANELARPYANSNPNTDQLIKRDHYDLSYNNTHEVANWVSYDLNPSHLKGCVPRADSFRIDPEVMEGSSSPADYKNSGFDRGHLLPAGDMKFDKEAMRNTFYMSNMTPQPAKFNRGRWSSLETLIRAWALKYNNLAIVTGPVLKDNLSQIGLDNKVSVPFEYFKVIIRKTAEGKLIGIGFLMNTDVPFTTLTPYALTINQVEEITGLNFFSSLGDDLEEEIESEIHLEEWDFAAKFNYLPCNL